MKDNMNLQAKNILAMLDKLVNHDKFHGLHRADKNYILTAIKLLTRFEANVNADNESDMASISYLTKKD